MGYKEDEVSEIIKMKKTNFFLDNPYNELYLPLMNEKYYLEKNLNNYLDYITDLKKENEEIVYSDVITMVNTKAYQGFYQKSKKADTSKGNMILVNKFYYLDKDYSPSDIVDMSNWYAFEGRKIKKEVYDAFIEMYNAAKKDGYTLIANSGYRDYAYQENLYNEYKDRDGTEYADTYAARPGYSEHQTGLSLDIVSYGATMENFDKTDTFKWLDAHAAEYGFILRYPKGKESITGYSYESWHFRYLGKDLAQKVKESNLTYDEYYAYYLDK
jgi:D-alanyl-D-alanine carboxypeptidase